MPHPQPQPQQLPETNEDITIRLPIQFDSLAYKAGWVHGVLLHAMEEAGYAGEPFVIFRERTGGWDSEKGEPKTPI